MVKSLCSCIARSSNGRTTDSGSVYRGSNPCWAAKTRRSENGHLVPSLSLLSNISLEAPGYFLTNLFPLYFFLFNLGGYGVVIIIFLRI